MVLANNSPIDPLGLVVSFMHVLDVPVAFFYYRSVTVL